MDLQELLERWSHDKPALAKKKSYKFGRLNVHIHDAEADWDESKVNRNASGEFAPKGSGKGGVKKGKQEAQENFQFAPTSKEKHTVANEIAHALKAHGYQKSKVMTPGGHYTFTHPSGEKVHVGPAFPNQTYSKGWRHSGGLGGAGGGSLLEYLNNLHEPKELAAPKKKGPQAKKAAEPEIIPPTKSGSAAHPSISVHNTLSDHGLVAQGGSKMTTTYALPGLDNGKIVVNNDMDNSSHKYNWYYDGPGGYHDGSGIIDELVPFIKQKMQSKTQSQPETKPLKEHSIIASKHFVTATTQGFKYTGTTGDTDKLEHPSGAQVYINENGNWEVYSKNGAMIDAGKASPNAFNMALEAGIDASQPASASKPATSTPASMDNIPNVWNAPIPEKVEPTAVNGGTGVMYSWDNGKKTLEIGTEEGKNEGEWYINDGPNIYSGTTQEQLNAAFEALHPRDESGHFIKKPEVDHLIGQGFDVAKEDDDSVVLAWGGEELTQIKFNKQTGSWKLYNDGHLADLGESNHDLEKGLQNIGIGIDSFPKAGATTPAAKPTITTSVKPPQNYVLYSEAQKLDFGGYQGEEDGVVHTLYNNKKLAVGQSGAWSLYNIDPYGNFTSSIVTGHGQKELYQAISDLPESDHEAAAAIEATSAAPTPAAAPPTPTPAPPLTATQSMHAHTDAGVNDALGKQGFSPVQTASTQKVKYNSPNGSSAYVYKQPDANGHYTWTYHPPNTPTYQPGISGTGLKELQATIANHEKPPKIAIGEPMNMADFKKKSGTLGTTPGGVYEKDGKDYYVKLQDEDHSRNESLAAALAGLAGMKTFDYHLLDNGGLATEWMKIDKTGTKELSKQDLDTVKADFAIHAWLANWDVAGAGTEKPEMNMGMVGDQSICLDWGGALLYTGLGKPKGMLFSDTVGEIDTLRDPSKNPSAAKLFKDISILDMKMSISRLNKITNSQIQQMVDQYGPQQQAVKDKLAATLIARKADLIAKGNSLVVPPPPPPPPIPVEQVQKQIDDAFERYTTSGYDGITSSMYSKAYHALGTHATPMSGTVASAISSYKGVGYQGQNKNARMGLADNDPVVKSITTYLNQNELPFDTVLVRRIKGEFAQHFRSVMHEGSEYTERGFVSSSLDPEKMKDWGPVDLIISVPKGTKGAYVNNDTESEILLQRETKIKIVSIHNINGKPTYVCMVTGQNPVK